MQMQTYREKLSDTPSSPPPSLSRKITNMSEGLYGTTGVMILGLGVLTIILLFIFAKRQIMRFALRSRRGPHIPIGHDGTKVIKREIERRIDLIPRVICEPQLIASQTDPRYILQPGQQIPAHYYRLKAVDDVKILEGEITRQDNCLQRHTGENLRAYLLTTLAAPLNGSGQRLIHQFCDLYEHARHDPTHFGDDEYQQYNRLLLKLVDAAKLLKSYNNSRKSSPSHRGVTQTQKQGEKSKSLLDPTRLHDIVDNDVLTTVESRPTSFLVPVTLADNETSV